jgi:amino acid permease
MYFICGFFGYIQFLSDTKDNILSNYDNDVLITMSKIGFFFIMVFSYPLFIHVCNEGTEKILFQKSEPNYPR